MTVNPPPNRPGLRLPMILGSVGMLTALGTLTYHMASGRDDQPEGWFAGYADVTLWPAYSFDVSHSPNVLLAFIVADPASPCTPHWGSVHSLGDAGWEVDLDTQLADFRAEGGSLGVSFGGAINKELATVCTDADQLLAAYRRVLDRYDVNTVDLDIEGNALADQEAGARRAQAFAALQAERGPDDEPLRVWLTVPVSPTGLTEDGRTAVQQMLDAGVELAGTNIMIMNYGGSRERTQSMVEASVQAAQLTHSQLRSIYRDAGEDLDGGELWSRIGLTPMIGRNEMPGEVFTLSDARDLNSFASSTALGRISMWSLNRDKSCAADHPLTDEPSPQCSETSAEPDAYAKALKQGFDGRME